MFISLYTNKHLKQLKQNILITGILLVGGGTFAIVRELTIAGAWRPAWFLGALLVAAAGMVCLAIARDLIPLKDAYFLMNPSRVSYRLTLLGKEQMLHWTDVAEVRVTDNTVVFELRDAKEVTMRLSNIPDEKVARHISVSISLAALEQNIRVNGVLSQPEQVVHQ